MARSLRSHVTDRAGSDANASRMTQSMTQSTKLIAQARQLDVRLRNVSQADRQLARRAAGHIVQLARRLSSLLSRSATSLPKLPSVGASSRISHYVLHAERVSGEHAPTQRVRMLTVGSNGMLRTGITDNDATSMIWVEYDPFNPTEGWDLDIVLERLADVLGRVESQVTTLETRSRERSQTLGGLMARSTPGALRAAQPSAGASSGGNASPLFQQPKGPAAAGGSAALTDALSDAMLDIMPSPTTPEAASGAGAPSAAVTPPDAAARYRKALFDRIK
ncbi:MAG: hypothetical protein V4617_11140 [Gemmatimonadota bacterium]